MTKRNKGARAQKSKRQRDQEKLLRLTQEGKTGNAKTRKCSTGKRIFEDKVSALLAVAENQRKDKQWRSKTEKRAYECPECSNFHITSREMWERNERPTYARVNSVNLSNDYKGNAHTANRSQRPLTPAIMANRGRFS